MGSNKTINDRSIALIIGLGILAALMFLFSRNDEQIQKGEAGIQKPVYKFGLNLDHYHIKEGRIGENQFLADLFLENKVNYNVINEVVEACNGIMDVRNFRAGKDFAFLSRDTTCMPDCFVYIPNKYEYLKIHLTDTIHVEKIEHEVDIKIKSATGVISSSLWNAMIDNGLSFDLAVKMEDAFGWAIDFHTIQKDDKFKLIYEQKYIDGRPVGIGDVKAAIFENYGNKFYAFNYESEKYKGYFDEKGRPMKKAFLKSPVKFARVSSGYNLNRFHPVLKRHRAHLGTDYAAPRGTPIMSVANGVVETVSYTKGNGNFIKIRHNKTYKTQYLHMSKFARGITSGVHVKQGQVIGYVGSTGLATGPHVCFRFWKNGKQIDHRRLNFPPSDPLPKEELDKFLSTADGLRIELDNLPYTGFVESIISDIMDSSSLKM